MIKEFKLEEEETPIEEVIEKIEDMEEEVVGEPTEEEEAVS
jgi:hypothetical protein